MNTLHVNMEIMGVYTGACIDQSRKLQLPSNCYKLTRTRLILSHTIPGTMVAFPILLGII